MRGWLKVALFAGVLIFAGVTSAQAKGTPNVEYTVHNLSAWMGGGSNPSAGYPTYEDQICIFCHTPHGGSLNGPLWNHSVPGASSFTHYNSATLSDAIRVSLSQTRPVNPESLLCMACHDGSIATNRVLNPSLQGQPESQSGVPQVMIDYQDGMFFPDGKSRPGPRIGAALGSPAELTGTGNLTDDHPISFSYSNVYSEFGMAQELHSVSEAEMAGVRFFPINGPDQADGKRVECSSCHDPHVDYDIFLSSAAGHVAASPEYNPFLVMPNTGSDLCLACHIK